MELHVASNNPHPRLQVFPLRDEILQKTYMLGTTGMERKFQREKLSNTLI